MKHEEDLARVVLPIRMTGEQLAEYVLSQAIWHLKSSLTDKLREENPAAKPVKIDLDPKHHRKVKDILGPALKNLTPADDETIIISSILSKLIYENRSNYLENILSSLSPSSPKKYAISTQDLRELAAAIDGGKSFLNSLLIEKSNIKYETKGWLR